MDSGQFLTNALKTSMDLRAAVLADVDFSEQFAAAAKLLLATKKNGGVIYSCGNGGSACDAVHFTEELVGRYRKERPGIRAAHLMDPAIMTCWSNDYSYAEIFSRQVQTMSTANDLLVCFSTSGNSANILGALSAAKATKTKTILLTGKDGGKGLGLADISLVVPAERTDRIQELHITLVHAFCELLEA